MELYLVHGPYVEEEWGVELESVWRGVERVWESGRAGAIGVSNFKVSSEFGVLPSVECGSGACGEVFRKASGSSGVRRTKVAAHSAPASSEATERVHRVRGGEASERVERGELVRVLTLESPQVHHLKQLLSFAKYKPAVNQIEFHPFNQDPELLAFHKEHGILTESYSGLVPLTKFAGVNPRFDGLLEELAQKYNRTKGQILLRWNLQTADVVVTTSNNEKRLPEYLGALEFELQDEDVDRLSKTAEGTVRRAYWTKYLGPNPE